MSCPQCKALKAANESLRFELHQLREELGRTGGEAPAEIPRPLTEKQQAFLAFLRGYIADHGYAPKTQEIADRMGWASRGVAVAALDRLVDRGVIRRLPRQARGIAIVEAKDARPESA